MIHNIKLLDQEIHKVLQKSGVLERIENWSAEASISIARPCIEDEQDYFSMIDFLEEYEFEIKFKNKRYLSPNNIKKLALISWYVSEEAHALISTLIESVIKTYHLELDEEFNMLHHSKAVMLSYFLEVNKTGHSLFGWLLQKDEKTFHHRVNHKIEWSHTEKERHPFEFLFKTLPQVFYFRKKFPCSVQRKRGYTDHGSLGSEFSKTVRDQNNDVNLYEAWLLTYQNRELQKDFILLTQGLLE